MNPMHSLLRRQLKRNFGDTSGVPAQWLAFINEVNDAYCGFDGDRAMLERSLDLSSQELITANSQMRAIFQAIPDLVMRLDRQGVILDVIAGATSEPMLRRGEFIGKQIKDTPMKEMAAQFSQAIQWVGSGNKSVSFEYSALSQGRESHYEARLMPLMEDQTVIILRDITERKNADRRVQDDLAMLRRAEQAAQAITQHEVLGAMAKEIAIQVRAVVGAHQCVVSLLDDDASGAGAAIVTGFDLPVRLTQAQLQAHPLHALVAARTDDRAPLRGWLATALKNRKGDTVGLLELSDKYDGEFTQQDLYVVEGLTHIASTALESLGLIDKISQLNTELERRVADRTEALMRQEAIFHAAADQAPLVMWIVNNKGAVTYLNRSWYALVGGAPPQWHGHQWTEAVAAEDVAEMRAKWSDVNRDGGIFSGVRHVRAVDGSIHTLAYKASPILDSTGEVSCWIGIDADITEIKAIETALRVSNREMEAFSYSVSHDLRGPLSAIDGFSQMLSRQLQAESDEKIQHYIARIRNGVARMSQLIESLLTLAQISRNTLQFRPVDLSQIATEVVMQMQTRDPERQVAVNIEPALVAKGDAGLLRVVIENLIGNAWKFTSRRTSAVISLGSRAAANGEPVFYVSDNGAGFDMKYAAKLFGTFQRLHPATEYAGTGVGLATVSRVIERHGGRVWAEAEPGKGATFFFTLFDTHPMALQPA